MPASHRSLTPRARCINLVREWARSPTCRQSAAKTERRWADLDSQADGHHARGLSDPSWRSWRQLVERAPHATPTLVEHVGMDHRRAHVAMTEELLDRSDIVARFEQVGCERVTR